MLKKTNFPVINCFVLMNFLFSYLKGFKVFFESEIKSCLNKTWIYIFFIIINIMHQYLNNFEIYLIYMYMLVFLHIKIQSGTIKCDKQIQLGVLASMLRRLIIACAIMNCITRIIILIMYIITLVLESKLNYDIFKNNILTIIKKIKLTKNEK